MRLSCYQVSSISCPSFDYIIVGGGLAGLVLAARLSEKAALQVLVVEAGQDQTTDPRANIPAMWPALLRTDSAWNLKTVPQVRTAGIVLLECTGLEADNPHRKAFRIERLNSHRASSWEVPVPSTALPLVLLQRPTPMPGKAWEIQVGAGPASPSP